MWGNILVARNGWKKIVKERKGRGYLTNLEKVGHPDRHLLEQYRNRWGGGGDTCRQVGGRRRSGGGHWTVGHINLHCHMSLFKREEFALLVGKGHWVVMYYLVSKELLGIRFIPPD